LFPKYFERDRRPQQFPAITAVSAAHGVSKEVVCLAWMLAKHPRILHIASARRLMHLEDSLVTAKLALSAEEVARIDGDGPDAAPGGPDASRWPTPPQPPARL